MENLYNSNDINVLNIQHTFYVDKNIIVKMFFENNFILKNTYNYKQDSDFYYFIRNNNKLNSKLLTNNIQIKNNLDLKLFYNNLQNKIKKINISSPFFICPSGVYGKMVYYYLNENTKNNVIGFLDSDARKINKRLSGTKCFIYDKKYIQLIENVVILIISERYKIEIINELEIYNKNIDFIIL